MARVTSSKIGEALVAFGIITEEEFHNCLRIVLDVPNNGLPVLYLERIMDDRMIDVATTLNGIEISAAPRLGRLHLDPGDKLIVKSSQNLTQAESAEWRAKAAAYAGLDANDVFILDPRVGFEVLKPMLPDNMNWAEPQDPMTLEVHAAPGNQSEEVPSQERQEEDERGRDGVADHSAAGARQEHQREGQAANRRQDQRGSGEHGDSRAHHIQGTDLSDL